MENPGEPWAYKEIGLSTLYLGKPDQALDWFTKADRIGPRDPGRWTWLDGRGHALILLGLWGLRFTLTVRRRQVGKSKTSRWAWQLQRLVLAPRGLTGLLNPPVIPARVDAKHRKLDAVKRRYLSEREVERLMAGFCSRPV